MKTNTASAAPAERRKHQRRDVDFAASVRFPMAQRAPAGSRTSHPWVLCIEFGANPGCPLHSVSIIASELFSADCDCAMKQDIKRGVLFTSGRAEALANFS